MCTAHVTNRLIQGQGHNSRLCDYISYHLHYIQSAKGNNRLLHLIILPTYKMFIRHCPNLCKDKFIIGTSVKFVFVMLSRLWHIFWNRTFTSVPVMFTYRVHVHWNILCTNLWSFWLNKCRTFQPNAVIQHFINNKFTWKLVFLWFSIVGHIRLSLTTICFPEVQIKKNCIKSSNWLILEISKVCRFFWHSVYIPNCRGWICVLYATRLLFANYCECVFVLIGYCIRYCVGREDVWCHIQPDHVTVTPVPTALSPWGNKVGLALIIPPQTEFGLYIPGKHNFS